MQSLANNKHNDHTTSYYLLHKQWVNSMVEEDEEEIKVQESQMITLSPTNFQNIIFKLQSMNEKSPEKVKNMIKIESEKDKILTCSASFQVKPI